MSGSEFRFDLLMSALAREAARIYTAPHLSHLEQETFCRAIEITRALVLDAAPAPFSRGTHLSEDTHLELRSLLRRIDQERWDLQMEAGAKGGFRYPLIRDHCADVVSFPGTDGEFS